MRTARSRGARRSRARSSPRSAPASARRSRRARSSPELAAPLIYGGAAGVLHLAAFGLDPLADKGMEGIDTFQQDRVARVVDEAERYLAAMPDAVRARATARSRHGSSGFSFKRAR